MRAYFFPLFCSATFLLCALSLGGGFAFSADVDLEARVPGCGDGVLDVGEECDTADLGGATCNSRGFTAGTLSCTASCLFNTTSCTTSGGGGGGGGGGSSSGGTAQVVLTGRAYPASVVTILKDGRLVAKTVASSLANFQVAVSGLSAGNYSFSVYGEDRTGLRSAPLTFPVLVTRGILTRIDDIFLAPTLAVDKSQVRKGDTIAIFGQSVPASNVTLEVHSPEQFFAQTGADKNGVYLHNFDTSVLTFGDHMTKSKSATSTEISPFSTEVDFKVGDQNVLIGGESTKCPKKADLNGDCKVNLTDFSIAAFWYKRPLSTTFAERERVQLNGDGAITIVDFSIMAFYWTG